MSYIRQRPLFKFRSWVIDSLDRLNKGLNTVENWNETEHRDIYKDLVEIEKRVENLEKKNG